MAGEPPTHRHSPPIRRRVVVVAEERNSSWRRVDNLSVPEFLPGGRSGDDTPNGGLSARVEVVVGEVNRKFFFG